MTDFGDLNSPPAISSLVDRLRTSLDGSELAEAFLTVYCRRLPADYAESVSEADLGAHINSVLEFASVRLGDDVLVRVFNPTVETHGYETPGAVVEVVSPDSAFLIDSVTNELMALGFSINAVIHPVIGTIRDREGSLTDILSARRAPTRDSVQHYELDRRVTAEEAGAVRNALLEVLADVRKVVTDFEPMKAAISRMVARAESAGARYSKEEVAEGVAFLRWLLDDNFVFLGFREYEIVGDGDGAAVRATPGSGLGILADAAASRFAAPVPLNSLSPAVRRRYEEGYLVIATKTNRKSRVHRRARMDYIGVRHVDASGNVTGETRMLGLFTSKAYMHSAGTVPILRRKLNHILEAEDAIAGSHHYKHVVEFFNSVPKEELFATETEELRASLVALIEAEEREQVRIFIRRDVLQRHVSVMVLLPHDRFNARVRKAIQEVIRERFAATSIDYRLHLGEGQAARIHFTVWVDDERVQLPDIQTLEAEVVDIARSWEERLSQELVRRHGDTEGRRLAGRWASRFPDSYQSRVPLDVAASDVSALERLRSDGTPAVAVWAESGGEEASHISVYMAGRRLDLSEVMPILEHFGLRVINEVPTALDGEIEVHIHDFTVMGASGDHLDVDDCGKRVADTIAAVLIGHAETDALDRLVINGLTYQQVALLRAYRTYWHRVGTEFTVSYMNETLAGHPKITARLVQLFAARFDPEKASPALDADLTDEIITALDRVASLDEDRILRGFLRLILATVRTNAYRGTRTSLSFKFSSAEVPGMPLPTPLYEIYVYAPDVEGIHLRGGSVARGGIRWSLRREDYRTEVLGLMKAQITKNAVIVPTGAKGGFVLRSTDEQPSHEAVRSAYKTYIRGLLDITDNRSQGEVVAPPNVIVHDGNDPYLVVAADRGTATFSDTANELAAEYDFWLGDAFASGGSAGYDHKVLGITARGAWESVRWHLREQGIDPDTDPFNAVGIGDMSGDVFGNGMLRSPTMRLIAAFDHRNIFIDPAPEPQVAFAERERLFAQPASSWEDYDASLISEGGGVFSRGAKRIELSAQAREALSIEAGALTPVEVTQAILRAPVDLIWNGGIGTFVKATGETNANVGDRNNDAIRIDAAALRARVVGEGGNLGVTQLGRIEFAETGGRVFGDFIDNSGGVNCSDREVNLKILLGLAVEHGALESADRDELVQHSATEVVERILHDNFLQAQVLSQELAASPGRVEAYEDLMSELEQDGLLDRSLENLPDSEALRERSRAGKGLLLPELALLLAYAKRSLTAQLLASDISDDPEFASELNAYFPESISDHFGYLYEQHPLRSELISTLVANRVINSEGITFVSRLRADTGMSAVDVVKAYQVARTITGAEERWAAIEDLVGHIDPALQRELLAGVDQLVEELTRWQLRSDSDRSISDRIDTYRPGFDELIKGIGAAGSPAWQRERQTEQAQLVAFDVPLHVAYGHVYQANLVHGCAIVETSNTTGRNVLEVSEMFTAVGSALHIDWLEERSEDLPTMSAHERQALRVVRDDLASLRRQLAEYILSNQAPDQSARAGLDHFLVGRTHTIGHLERFFRTVSSDSALDIASLVVATHRVSQLLG